jgi:hypothetical protein
MNIGGRREPTKIGGFNKLAAGSAALTFQFKMAMHLIKALSLHEQRINRTKHFKNCASLSEVRLLSVPTSFLPVKLCFLPDYYQFPTLVG